MKTGDTNTQNVHPSEMSIPSVHKLKERLIQIQSLFQFYLSLASMRFLIASEIGSLLSASERSSHSEAS